MSTDAQILEGMGDYKYGFRDPENLVFKSRKGLDREVVALMVTLSVKSKVVNE